MIVYSDFQCPYCKKFALETLPKIQERFVATNQLAVVFRHLPIEQAHQFALGAAIAGVCANKFGAFWPLHDGVFGLQSPPDQEGLIRVAHEVGIDVVPFTDCLSDPAAASRVRKDADEARRLGVRGTPAFVIGSRRSTTTVQALKTLSGARPFDDFVAAITEAIGRQ
jgi:protein-disulfide isomerase